MGTAIIKLVYKQVIDASSAGSFEKNVFQATYNEFLLKSQTYNQNGEYQTFTALKANDGRANSLHYKISFAAAHLLERLNNQIPELQDNLGNKVLFDVARFELIESDITNKAAHKLAVNYITNSLTLFEIIGEYLVLANGIVTENEPAETFILKMRPNLSISEFHIPGQPVVNTRVPMHNN